jgi:hypothetical protein
MSTKWQSLTSVESALIEEPDEWRHLRKDVVFRERDKGINAVHNGTSKKRGQAFSFDEEMSEESPFPDKPDIGYEVELNQNLDFDKSDSLDWSELDVERESGNLYQLNLNESLVYGSKDIDGEYVNGKSLAETDLDTGLNLHAIVYEEENGKKHLMHWDPGVYDSEGDKHKYREDDGSPDFMEVAEEGEDVFENYEVMELEKGLEHIYDELIKGSEEIEQSAHRQMLENSGQKDEDLGYSDEVLEEAWMAERWRGMADAVKTFNRTIQEGYGQQERISF